MSLVTPAVLPSSREALEEGLAVFVTIPDISRVQIDVVDGKFAAPASWPYSVGATNGMPSEIETMIKNGEMLPDLDHIEYEIDLMCLDAERAAGDWLALGASRLTFHAESVANIPRLFDSISRRYGDDCVTFGLALNIESDLALIEPHLSRVEYVQFMGIASIGKQGQPFDARVFEKVRRFHSRYPEIRVQVDGGVSLDNAKKLLSLGVSDLIVGSAILRTKNIVSAYAAFEALQSPYGV